MEDHVLFMENMFVCGNGQMGELVASEDVVLVDSGRCLPHGLGGTEARHVGCIVASSRPEHRFCFAFVSWCLGLGKKGNRTKKFQEVRSMSEKFDPKGTCRGEVLKEWHINSQT